MSKTLEQMEQEHYMRLKKQLPHAPEEQVRKLAREAFVAGYKAAQDKYEAEITELKTNFTFCCGDKARLLQELAAKEASHYKVL